MNRRNTPAKQAVKNILTASKGALSQDDIEQKVKGTMDRVTVYRILNSFNQDGFVHKILADDGKQYYAVCLNCAEKKHHDNHFHFRCLKCHTIECLHQEVKFNVPAGYNVEGVNCLLSGVCGSCHTQAG